MNSLAGRAVLLLGLTVIVVTACSGESPMPSRGEAAAADFATVLRAVSYDYEPFDSPGDLARAADLVVVGRITGARGGRRLEAGPQATLTVAVEKIIKGSADALTAGTAYVEIPTAAGAEVADLQAAIPSSRVVLFLADRTGVPGTGASGTEGARIFTPYPQGVIMEDGQGFIGGIEDLGEMSPQWNAAADFDTFVADLLRSLI